MRHANVEVSIVLLRSFYDDFPPLAVPRCSLNGEDGSGDTKSLMCNVTLASLQLNWASCSGDLDAAEDTLNKPERRSEISAA